MNQDWADFISANATVSHDQTPPDCALMSLDDWGLIRLSGEDTRDFLQGQVTCDVREVDDKTSRLGSHLSPKGRMMATFRLFQHRDDLYLQLPRERIAALLKRLKMFVLRAQVAVEDVSDQLIQIGLAGNCLADLLGDKLPSKNDSVWQDEALAIIRIPDATPRALIIANSDDGKDFWTEMAQKTQISGSDLWKLFDIRAALPSVIESTNEAFVPQMTNLHALNGVSFTKGCYTGQEVVSRMQYLGKLKRRMYRIRFTADSMPEPGLDLFAKQSTSGQGAGKLVDICPSPTGGFEALAVIEISTAESDTLFIGSLEGPAVEIDDLPYEMPAQKTTDNA